MLPDQIDNVSVRAGNPDQMKALYALARYREQGPDQNWITTAASNLANLYGTGKSIANAMQPGTPENYALIKNTITNPTQIVTEPIKSVSRVLDVLPFIDTGQSGVDYRNLWEQGQGLTVGVNDLLNLIALGKAGAAGKGALSRAVALPDPQEVLAANEAARRAALYEFANNPNRAAAIEALPLPTGVEPPRIVVPSDIMMDVLDEGYKTMWEGGRRYVEGSKLPSGEYDYPSMRRDVEANLFGGKQPISGFGGNPAHESMAAYGGYSWESPDYGLARFPGSYWEVKPRLNRQMTVTPGDSFSVSPEEVRPYQRGTITPQKQFAYPEYDYNEVQMYGGKIPPNDLMEFSLNMVDPLMNGASPAHLAMTEQNLSILQRLIKEDRPVNVTIYDAQGNPTTLSAEQGLKFLQDSQTTLKDMIRRRET